MQYTRVEQTYTGRGTKMGSPALTGRPITAAHAMTRLHLLDIDISYARVLKLCKELKLPKVNGFWYIEDDDFTKLKARSENLY